MKAIVLLPLVLLLGSLKAQNKVPPMNLRFIPLGERPVWKGGKPDPNGVIPGIAPPKGAMPPVPLSVLSGEALLPFRPDLRSFSETLTINGATPRLVLQSGKPGAAQNWLTHKMPTAPLSLGVLYREHQVMNWNNPKILLLDDTPAAFPAGTARFVNVSEHLALVQIGDPDAKPAPPIFGVPAGKSIQKPIKAGNNQIRVGYLAPGNAKEWIISNTIKMEPNQRLQAFFYKAQGKKPRQLVKFHFTPENLPK